MLDAGAGRLAREGITVGFDHLRLEAVIADAAVARSSAYRHWPNKDAYLRDLLRHLADANEPPVASDSSGEALVDDVRAAGAGGSPLGVALEIVRRGVRDDLSSIIASPQWRLHLALTAAAPGFADAADREYVQARLHATERRTVDRIATRYEATAAQLGLRRRPDAPPWPVVARLILSQLRGAALQVPADDVGPVPAGPDGAAGDWHPVAWAVGTLLVGVLEPGGGGR